jgi:hypothetical protein
VLTRDAPLSRAIRLAGLVDGTISIGLFELSSFSIETFPSKPFHRAFPSSLSIEPFSNPLLLWVELRNAW